MKNNYEQTTYETCLACCLLQFIDSVKLNQDLELECINYSMKFSKEDFVIGHLNFITEKFGIEIERIVDNKLFFDYIMKIKTSELIHTEVKKINLDLIDNLLQKSSVILYIDAYYFYKIVHYPHFITVLNKEGKNYKLLDNWDGKEKIIDEEILSQSIISLRNHLKFCPQIIILNKNL